MHSAGTDFSRLIMFSTIHTAPTALALSFILLPSSARVIWIPEEFDPLAGSNSLVRRDTSTCGGNASLTPCGGAMPSDFCCPATTTCLALSTNSSVTAAICCPEGQDCVKITPVDCDMSLQNLTNTQLHASPPQPLGTCGGSCCPMGYTCTDDFCVAQAPPTPASSPAPSASTSSSSTLSPTASSSTSTPTAGAAAASRPLDGPTSASSGSDFDGKSFAAGLIPGLAIGAIIAACLILLIFRKKRHSSDSSVDEKHNNRDTLTDLGTLDRRPTMHSRSISEPQPNPSGGYRTDFLRGTPPKAGGFPGTDANGYSVDIRSPASRPVTPSNSPPRVKALFSRSPFMIQTPSTPRSTQPPIPGHLKRGTLSFKISPVRALKKQKSMHSLRRQMTDASRGSENSRSDSRRRLRPDLSRSTTSGSTETIQVLMPSNEPYTPERPPQMVEKGPKLSTATYEPPESAASTWHTTSGSSNSTPDERQQPQASTPYASSSRYPSEVQAYTTPTRPPIPRQLAPSTLAFLGSPYTPSNNEFGGKGRAGNGGLGGERKDTRRDTTFSAMMERAGLRKSDLLVGTGNKKT